MIMTKSFDQGLKILQMHLKKEQFSYLRILKINSKDFFTAAF